MAEVSNYESVTGYRDHRVDLDRYIKLVVTGKYANGDKNFPAKYYEATEAGLDAAFAPPKANPNSIGNLAVRWNVWGVKPDGTRKLIWQRRGTK